MENQIYDNTQEQEIKLSDYMRIVARFKWIILLIFIVVFTATVIYTIKSPKIYRASSRILIESGNKEMSFFSTPGIASTSINNNIEILKSRPVMELAYGLLKLEDNFEEFPISMAEDPVRVLLGIVEVETKRETDILTISCESTNPEEAQKIANAAANALSKQSTLFARTELKNMEQFLESNLESLNRRLRNSEEDLRKYKLENGISLLSEETRKLIENVSDVETLLQAAETDYSIATEQLKYLKSELTMQDSIVLDVNSLITSPFFEELRKSVVDNQARLANLLTKDGYNADHPELIELNNEIENAKKKLVQEVKRIVAVKVGSTDPLQYRATLIQKIALAQIDQNVADSKINSLKKAVGEYNKKITILPDTELELARLTRTYAMNDKIHAMLVEKYEDAKIAEHGQMGNIRMVEAASLPLGPIKPKKKMNLLIGLVLGIGLGVGVAFLIHSLDTKLRTLSDVETWVKLPIIGTIPFIRLSEAEIENVDQMILETDSEERIEELKKSQYHMTTRLITHYAPKSPVAEAYRTLRTNIISKNSTQKKALKILVTSSGPKEGKSTTISNLAIAIAQMDAKVILMDLDMRRPVIHSIFNLDKKNGASDYLSDTKIKIDDICKKSDIDNLDVITSGLVPPNPSEMLASSRMSEFFDELEEKYDYILVDSPPVIAVTDAMILANQIDVLSLVVRTNVTDRNIILRTKEILANINVNISGIIVNGIDVQKYYSGYAYYYYYYYYYYGEGKDKKNKFGLDFLRKNKRVS